MDVSAILPEEAAADADNAATSERSAEQRQQLIAQFKQAEAGGGGGGVSELELLTDILYTFQGIDGRYVIQRWERGPVRWHGAVEGHRCRWTR